MAEERPRGSNPRLHVVKGSGGSGQRPGVRASSEPRPISSVIPSHSIPPSPQYQQIEEANQARRSQLRDLLGRGSFEGSPSPVQVNVTIPGSEITGKWQAQQPPPQPEPVIVERHDSDDPSHAKKLAKLAGAIAAGLYGLYELGSQLVKLLGSLSK